MCNKQIAYLGIITNMSSLLTFLLGISFLPEGSGAVSTNGSPIVYQLLQFFAAFFAGHGLSVCATSWSGGETCLLLASGA